MGIAAWTAVGAAMASVDSYLLWSGLRSIEVFDSRWIGGAADSTAKIERRETALDSHPNVPVSLAAPSATVGEKSSNEPHERANVSENMDVYIADEPRLKQLLVEKLAASGWDPIEIADLKIYLSDKRARFSSAVLAKNATHIETESQYAHNLTDESLNYCLDFLASKGKTLRAVAKAERFPWEVVAAILKVETNFGKNLGRESVFNVFWTLSLADEPEAFTNLAAEVTDDEMSIARLGKRASWARKELRDLLYMAREGHGEDPVGIMGSWAGAFGLCQFIPSSYRAYGKDGSGDGTIDLDDLADATASIANFLKRNHWPSDGSKQKMKKALMRYNHSSHYAECVISLAAILTVRVDAAVVLQ